MKRIITSIGARELAALIEEFLLDDTIPLEAEVGTVHVWATCCGLSIWDKDLDRIRWTAATHDPLNRDVKWTGPTKITLGRTPKGSLLPVTIKLEEVP